MRIKAITNLFQHICFDSQKASIHFSTCKLGLLLRRQCLPWVHSPSDELVCLHRTVRMLTNYFLGIRINYHKSFERARNLHLLLPGCRLVIYPMSGNNVTLKIDFTDPRKRNFVRNLFFTGWIGNDTPAINESLTYQFK